MKLTKLYTQEKDGTKIFNSWEDVKDTLGHYTEYLDQEELNNSEYEEVDEIIKINNETIFVIK